MSQELQPTATVTRQRLRDRAIIAIALLIMVLGSASLALRVAVSLDGRAVWDDSYMFVRYASNLVNHGVLAWNPGGPPTYGLTSLLFLAVVVPLRLAFDSPIVLAVASSVVSGILFLGLVAGMLGDVAGRREHAVIGAYVVVALMLAGPTFYLHFVGGMDTLFAMAYVTLYIIVARRFEQAPGLAIRIAMGVIGGLAFAARPDLLLFTWLVPLVVVGFAREAAVRRAAVQVLALTVGLTAAQMALAAVLLGTPLPLPFFAKSLANYDGFNLAAYAAVPREQLLQFASGYGLLLLPIGLNLVVYRRRFWRRCTAVEKGLLLAAVLFALYYLFFVLQIMYFFARFYQPLLPVLVLLAGRSIASLLAGYRDDLRPRIRQTRLVQRVELVLGAGVVCSLVILLGMDILALVPGLGRTRHLDPAGLYYAPENDWYRANWFRLPEFAALSDQLVVAATEVGLPGIMGPGWTIIDLSGLNDPEIARDGFDGVRFFENRQPDLIIMPHPDYGGLIEAIQSAPYFQRHYDFYPADSLDTAMGIALWRDSFYYAGMATIAQR